MFLTDSHAFIGVYIGDDSIINAVTTAIQEYYHSELNLFWFEDSLGNWLIIDTVGSFYTGDLPLGSAPVMEKYSSFGKHSWTWDFTETEKLYIVDVKPE